MNDRSDPVEAIQAGVAKYDALAMMRESCNRGPHRLFVTEGWFAPRLARFEAALSDPVDAEEAAVLRDVVLKREQVDDVLPWLEWRAGDPAKTREEFATFQLHEAEMAHRRLVANIRASSGPRCSFPWPDIEACLEQELTDEERASVGPTAFRSCPRCDTPLAELRWIHFRSPPWTWKHLCGRGGIMIVCVPCKFEAYFQLTVMN